MREYILTEKSYLNSSTTRPLRSTNFAYPVLIFCDRKLLMSTARHLFLHNLRTRHLFCDIKLLKSTAGHPFLHTLSTSHLFCDGKFLKSTAGHPFLHNFPTRHLLCDRKLLKSTATHLFLHTLPTRHLFCNRKILCMHIKTAGHRGFGVIAPGCQVCRHRVAFCH